MAIDFSNGLTLGVQLEAFMSQDGAYEYVVVESFRPASTSGLHGDVHIRPVAGGKFPVSLHVACSKRLSRDYPVGTRFRLRIKLTNREDGGEYLYSHHTWPHEVFSQS